MGEAVLLDWLARSDRKKWTLAPARHRFPFGPLRSQ